MELGRGAGVAAQFSECPHVLMYTIVGMHVHALVRSGAIDASHLTPIRVDPHVTSYEQVTYARAGAAAIDRGRIDFWPWQTRRVISVRSPT